MQQVYYITDCWDNIPINGIAGYNHKHFYFHREFSEVSDDWTDIYRLTELSEDIFKLFLKRREYWNIWKRQSKIPHPVQYQKIRNQKEIQDLIVSDNDFRKAEEDYIDNQIISEFLNKNEFTIKKRGKFYLESEIDSERLVEWSDV